MESMEAQVGACRRLEAADLEVARLRQRVSRLERQARAGAAVRVTG